MDREKVFAGDGELKTRVELLGDDEGAHFAFGMLPIGKFHPWRRDHIEPLDDRLMLAGFHKLWTLEQDDEVAALIGRSLVEEQTGAVGDFRLKADAFDDHAVLIGELGRIDNDVAVGAAGCGKGRRGTSCVFSGHGYSWRSSFFGQAEGVRRNECFGGVVAG